MIEIAEFRPEEIDEAIEGIDGLQGIIAPFLRNVNKDGMGEQDVQQFVRHLTLAKHALIAMGDFLEGKMKPNVPLTLEELREMGGEPVYLVFGGGRGEWAIVHLEWHGCKPASGGAVFFDRYGEHWLAYRRKPEKGRNYGS